MLKLKRNNTNIHRMQRNVLEVYLAVWYVKHTENVAWEIYSGTQKNIRDNYWNNN